MAPVFRCGALASAIVCLGLAFMTQSRGVVVGLAVGGLAIALLSPDRVRRVWVAGLAVICEVAPEGGPGEVRILLPEPREGLVANAERCFASYKRLKRARLAALRRQEEIDAGTEHLVELDAAVEALEAGDLPGLEE